jgi:tetratricopeptide (TPR) repeat protein
MTILHATNNRTISLIFVSLLAVIVSSSTAQEGVDVRSTTIVARTQMQLKEGNEVIGVIDKGDLLTVTERRDDAYVVLTHNGKRGLVAKENAANIVDSIEIYNQLINENPRQGRLFTLRASAWWARGEPEKALEDYDRAIELGYKEPHAFSSRGLFHAALGNYEKAVADFTTAIDRGAKDDLPFINRAAVYLSQQKDELALKDYDEAIRLLPNKPTAYQLRAVLHKNRGDLDLAIRDFSTAIELDLDNVPALMGRGYVWFQKGYWRKAIDDFTAVIKVDPKSARAFNNRGYNRQLVGEYEGALADYEEAIRLAPKFALAYQNKAWLLAAADDPNVRDGNKAIEAANQACELNNFKSLGDLKSLAAAYAEDNQFDKAILWQQKALDLAPDEHKPMEEQLLKTYRDKKPIRFADFQTDGS